MSAKQNNKPIVFGTDGWRAVIAEEFTFKNVQAVAQATADYLLSSSKKGKKKKYSVVVGYDTRFLSEKFAEIVACVFAANGIGVILADAATPTPTISFAVRNRKLDLGVVITASHNPPEFNGFKIKNSTGGSADPSITKKVEQLVFKHKVKTLALQDGVKKKLISCQDISSDYVRFLRSYLDLEKIKGCRFRVLVDCMFGSGNGFIKKVLEGTAVEVVLMRNERNAYFGGHGPEPVEKYLGQMSHRMKTENFDLGLVLDGDADRIAAFAKGGEFLHPQKILGLLALHLKEDRAMSGALVTTIAGTMLLGHIAEHLKIKTYETPVGFKYISRLMETEDILVGGEEAGGIGFKNYVPERDGSLAGLLLLEMMAYRNASIDVIVAQMEQQFGRYYYLRDAVHLRPGKRLKDVKTIRPKQLLGSNVISINDADGIKLICEDESWLMFRSSGTEPLVRVYCEAKSLQKAQELLSLGKELVCP